MRASLAVVSTSMSKGWRRVATTSPSSQVQFDSTNLRRRRFSRGSCLANSRDYGGVPSVAFTLPPIAAVGLSEAEARKQSPNVRMDSATVPEWYTARRMAEPVYGYKTLVEAESGRILSAHLVGPHADEVINLFGLAIRHNLTADDLKTTHGKRPEQTFCTRDPRFLWPSMWWLTYCRRALNRAGSTSQETECSVRASRALERLHAIARGSAAMARSRLHRLGQCRSRPAAPCR
jgi:hypothetical protein